MTALRQFGLELEVYNAAVPYAQAGSDITRAIRGMGYSAVRTDRHFDTDYDVWQMKPDVSLAPAGFALEVVSPTLPGNQASIDQVTKVAQWLSANGYSVNQSMGYHIHIDAADLTSYECAAIALRYHHRQREIDSILPPSRRGSRWAQPLAGNALSKITDTVRAAQRTTRWTPDERYVAVNLQHVSKARPARRIEFRQHSGTVNVFKIVGWYKFLCEFIAETLRIIRAGNSVPAVAAPTTTATPIIRRQRTARGATRSVVVGTTEEPRIPVIEDNTDYDVFLRLLERNGVVTQQDARMQGWPETRLRVTAHWLRRNGAELVTTQRNGELAYVGRNGATTRAAIFVNPAQIRTRVEAAVAPVQEAPTYFAPIRATNAILDALAAAPIEQGLSPESAAWFNARRISIATR